MSVTLLLVSVCHIRVPVEVRDEAPAREYVEAGATEPTPYAVPGPCRSRQNAGRCTCAFPVEPAPTSSPNASNLTAR